MKWVYMVALLAWGPDGEGTADSGRFQHTTLSDCHARSRAFTTLHGTPLQQCKRMSLRSWQIIASAEVEFDFAEGDNGKSFPEEEENNDEVERLLAALKAIGRLHRGKTRDSQKVRAIIKKATQ